MKLFSPRITPWLSILCAIITYSVATAQDVRFIPATPENTRLADGSPLPEKMESIGWKWLPGEGGDGGIETVPAHDGRSAILMLNAAALQPGAVYEVFGFFWADEAPIEETTSHQRHAVQLGLSLATMQAFDGERPDALVSKEPWVITPGYLTGQAYGYQAVVEESDPLPGLSGIAANKGNSRLIRARLGCSRAGKDGTLPVFFSANSGSRAVGGAMVDGIAIRSAAPDASVETGRNPGTRLHLAIRAGDPVTVRREIAAGTDVNGFDEEQLTPLFYAAACGDAALVRDLLDHGARPDQAAQSVSPLTAAATLSDPAIVKILLEAGAGVPPSTSHDQGALAIDTNPRFLHPVFAAIRAGSVPVLKQLLAANQALNLTKFETELLHMGPNKPRIPHICLVETSMMRGNWEMAAYLIDSGVPISSEHFAHYTNSKGLMLACAAHAGAEALPVIEAMLRRGEPPVVEGSHSIYQRDALVTAAWRGDVELVRRFLPFATDVGSVYQNWLLEHALYSGKERIIEMIRGRFPAAKAPRWQPDLKNEGATPLEEAAKRWFLPRTSPPPQGVRKQAKGKHVLAVVAAPDAAAAGDTLAAHASHEDGWKVVDREQIEAALGEDRFSKPWLDGEHRLADLGDRLLADCLIVVSSIPVGKESICRFEVVEVATGLEIHREHFKSDAFQDEKEVSGFLARAARALDSAGRNDRHQAITLLSFSTQGRISDPLAISGLLRAAVQHEVDSTPGLISLSRSQSARLVEEQALDGKNSVWGAAHMLEGVVSSNGDAGIKVTIRLETFKNGVTRKTDVEAVGKATAIGETAAAAWNKLLAISGNQIAAADGNPDDIGRSLNEGRRLMREAEWFHTLDADPASYLPLIESAIALGVPAEETTLLHLDACFRQLEAFYKNHTASIKGDNTTALQHLREILPHRTASLALSDQLAYQLPAARKFLHQASWYLERRGKDALDGGTDLWQVYGTYKYNEIWYAIQALSAIRALIIPGHLPDHLGPEFETFAAELDALTRHYFTLLQTVPDPDFYRYCLQAADFRLCQRNPALAEGLAAMAAKGASLTVLLRVPSEEADSSDQFQWMQSRKDLARKMIGSIANNPSLRMRLSKADLECFVADGAQRPHTIRQLLGAYAEARWHTTPTRDDSGTSLLSQVILNSCTTARLFDRDNFCSLEHDGSVLPSVLFSARPAPDHLIRFNAYHEIFCVLNQQEAWKQGGNPNNIDPFRERIIAYDPWELRRLKAETSSRRPVNGPSTQTSSRHGPPGIPMTPKSRNLYTVICGGGKNREKPEYPPVPPKEPETLKATLLADLRTSRSPGTIIWPLVDNVDSDLLWVFYFPSAGDGIRVNQPGGGGAQPHDYECTAPWLLGINCRDGSVVRKVNLHSAVGEAYGMDLSNRKCVVWGMSLDQTRDRILTSVGWYDKGWASNKMGSVIIDKETGRAHPIAGNPKIAGGKGDVSLDLWSRDNGVAAVGGRFFYLANPEGWNGGAIEGLLPTIFQVSPDLSVKSLTVTGRRPEMSPFDALNRAPIAITPHGGRLMVIHPSIIAEYDPEGGDWSITASLPSEKPTNKHTNTVADAQYWDFLRSIHELKIGGESTGWIAVGWWHRPGVLPFASRTKAPCAIRITAGIPDDFLNATYAIEETKYDKNGAHPGKKTLIKDHPRFKESNMVVLAQTEEDLILGMQTSDYYEWKHPSRNAHHLPFLWKISKNEILEILQTSPSR